MTYMVVGDEKNARFDDMWNVFVFLGTDRHVYKHNERILSDLSENMGGFNFRKKTIDPLIDNGLAKEIFSDATLSYKLTLKGRELFDYIEQNNALTDVEGFKKGKELFEIEFSKMDSTSFTD